jgi:hypothetical protein
LVTGTPEFVPPVIVGPEAVSVKDGSEKYVE